jgi:histo-blood group ABO system transferase
MDIGIILISTKNYNVFVDNLVSNIREKVFKNSQVSIILFTDDYLKHDVDKTIKIQHQNWPLMTLKRYHIILDNIDIIDSFDYIFYIDVDSIINLEIDEHLLNYNFVVVEHCGWRNTRGTPENNPISTAYISNDSNITYVAGGFLGGKKDIFIKLANTLKENIDIDLKNNYIAKWHDESHLNRYVLDNPSIKILDYKYMYIKSYYKDNKSDFNIIALDKKFKRDA